MLGRLLLAVLASCGVAFLGCSTEREPAAKAPSEPRGSSQVAAKSASVEAAPLVERADRAMRLGAQWLLKQQKDDGTFGGPAEVGKTASSCPRSWPRPMPMPSAATQG